MTTQSRCAGLVYKDTTGMINHMTTQSRCAGLVNVRSAHILKLTISTNAVPTGGGGSRYKLTGPGGPEGVSGFDYAAYVLVFPASSFCPLYKLTLSDQLGSLCN